MLGADFYPGFIDVKSSYPATREDLWNWCFLSESLRVKFHAAE